MRIKYLCSNAIYSAYSIYTIARELHFLSNLPSVPSLKDSNNKELFIISNGPSLNADIKDFRDILRHKHTLMMNNAILTPLFEEIKPRYYVIMDSLYFIGDTYNVFSSIGYQNANATIAKVWNALNAISDDLYLFVPHIWRTKPHITNPKIRIKTFGINKYRGFERLAKYLFTKSLALPSYNNVLVPSIVCALAMGYQTIYLLGCDHSWYQNYYIDKNNNLSLQYHHFYKEKNNCIEFNGLDIATALCDMGGVFKAYKILHKLFKESNIVNLSSDSMIDAFPRDKLESVLKC